MPTLTATFNAYDPACTVTPCLEQIAGWSDFNPGAQYSACLSMFGSPVVTTVYVGLAFHLDTPGN